MITREHPMARVASYSGNDAPNRRVIKKKGPGPGSQAQGPGPGALGPAPQNKLLAQKEKKHLAWQKPGIQLSILRQDLHGVGAQLRGAGAIVAPDCKSSTRLPKQQLTIRVASYGKTYTQPL